MKQNYTEDDFIKGINAFGEAEQKKQLEQIQEELEQAGFFEENTDLIIGIEHQGEKELRKNITVVQKDLEQEGFFPKDQTTVKKSLVPLFRVVLAAASIILLIWVGRSWLFIDNNNDNNNTEFVAIEDIDQVPEDLLSESIVKELSESGFGGAPQELLLTELQAAMKNYQKGEYAIASEQLKAVLDNPIPHPFVTLNKFYLAISYLETEQTTVAIELLEQLKRSENTDQNAIRWYLALAYYKIEQPEKSKAILNDWQPLGDYKLKKQQLSKIIEESSLSQ